MEERCSFCGKSESDKTITYLIKGKFGNICDNCVRDCNETLLEQKIQDIIGK